MKVEKNLIYDSTAECELDKDIDELANEEATFVADITTSLIRDWIDCPEMSEMKANAFVRLGYNAW